MSTHCLIGYQINKNLVRYAWVMTDGYPEHMVPILRTIEDEDFLVEKIIKVNEFRHLYEDCSLRDPFEETKELYCTVEEFITGQAAPYTNFAYLYKFGEWRCYGFNPDDFDEEEWEDAYKIFSELLDLENPNEDGSYNFYYAPSTDYCQYLVQRVCLWDNDTRENTIMNSDELIHYIDMLDYCHEKYKIYEITEFGTFREIFYRGWQPDCLIEFVDNKGQVVLSGRGTDH
jgi:hypothetical protein